MWLASSSVLGTQQTGLGRQDYTLRSSHSCRRNPPTKYTNGIISAMITVMKTIKRDVTVSDTTRDLNRLKRALAISQTPPAGAQSPRPPTPPRYSPFYVNTIRKGAGGRCIQVGLFQGRISPAPVGTSRGPLAHDTGRPPGLRPPLPLLLPLPRGPQHSQRGSRKLLDFTVAAAFARNRNPGPAPPERLVGTQLGVRGLHEGVEQNWAAGPALPGPLGRTKVGAI